MRGTHAFPLWATLAALGVGLLSAVQSRVNGSLADALGNGLEAATISFTIGFLSLTVALGLLPRMREGLRRLRGVIRERGIARWQLFGGVLGAFFVLTQTLSVPVGGVALFAVTTVSGQTVASLIVDRVGLGPMGRQAWTAGRILSAGIAIAAVACAVAGRWGGESLSLLLVVMGLAAGGAIAVQQAINGRVSTASGEPLVAAWVSFLTGTIALIAAAGIAVLAGVSDLSPPPGTDLWLYSGGVLGAIFIATAAWVVGRVGVLRLALLSIAGQLLGAIAFDLAFTDYVDVGLIVGVALAFTAVAVNGVGRRVRPGMMNA